MSSSEAKTKKGKKVDETAEGVFNDPMKLVTGEDSTLISHLFNLEPSDDIQQMSSSDQGVVLSGFILRMQPLEINHITIHFYTFIYVAPDGFANELDIRLGDILMKVNKNDCKSMSVQEMETVLEQNVLSLVIGRWDRHGFQKIWRHIYPSGVHTIPKPRLDCKLTDTPFGLIKSEFKRLYTCYVKLDAKYLCARGETVELVPALYGNDESYIFTFTETHVFVYDDQRWAHVCAIFNTDNTVLSSIENDTTNRIAVVDADEVDRKIRVADDTRSLYADDGFFLQSALAGLKCTLESSEHRGYYMGTIDGRTCQLIKPGGNPNEDARIHFTLVPVNGVFISVGI